MSADVVDSFPSVDELVSRASEIFRSIFRQEPTNYGAAPGRVNLIGEHVDYCDGYVLPMALPMGTVVVGSKAAPDSCCQIVSTNVPGASSHHSACSFPLPTPQKELLPGEPSWANYVKGVVANFPGPLVPFNAVVASSVPIGAGLSSSAALETATFFFLESSQKGRSTRTSTTAAAPPGAPPRRCAARETPAPRAPPHMPLMARIWISNWRSALGGIPHAGKPCAP